MKRILRETTAKQQIVDYWNSNPPHRQGGYDDFIAKNPESTIPRSTFQAQSSMLKRAGKITGTKATSLPLKQDDDPETEAKSLLKDPGDLDGMKNSFIHTITNRDDDARIWDIAWHLHVYITGDYKAPQEQIKSRLNLATRLFKKWLPLQQATVEQAAKPKHYSNADWLNQLVQHFIDTVANHDTDCALTAGGFVEWIINESDVDDEVDSRGYSTAELKAAFNSSALK